VIEDVISGVKDEFIDEAIDQQVLMELKQIWENKLTATKVIVMKSEVIDLILDPAELSLQNKVQKSELN